MDAYFFFYIILFLKLERKLPLFCFPFAKRLLNSMNWLDHIFYLIWSETRRLARMYWQTGWRLNRYLFRMVYDTSFHRPLYYLFLSKGLKVGLRCTSITWTYTYLVIESAFNSSLIEAVTLSVTCFYIGRYDCNRLWTRSHYSFFLCLDWTEGTTRDSLYQTLAYCSCLKWKIKLYKWTIFG